MNEKTYFKYICPICNHQPFFRIITDKSDNLLINYSCLCGKFSDNYEEFFNKCIPKDNILIDDKCIIHSHKFN